MLKNGSKYKEVVRFDDENIRHKIHITYRLQYLKDVVLARILDDPTFSALNGLIFFNQVDIVNHVHKNVELLTQLFGTFKSPDAEPRRKKDAVLFIQQSCMIAKSLQQPTRHALYNNLVAQGLMAVIEFGLHHADVTVRVGASDILVSLIDNDPQMVRATIYRQLSENKPALTDSLIDLLLVEVDLGVRSQLSDSLRVLMDQGGIGADFSSKMKEPDPQQELFLGKILRNIGNQTIQAAH